MKEKIRKLINNFNIDKVAIMGFGFAIIITSIPLLLVLAYEFLIPSDACFWHDGGECPLCGW